MAIIGFLNVATANGYGLIVAAFLAVRSEAASSKAKSRPSHWQDN
jgi:hypothetical protein